MPTDPAKWMSKLCECGHGESAHNTPRKGGCEGVHVHATSPGGRGREAVATCTCEEYAKDPNPPATIKEWRDRDFRGKPKRRVVSL